MFLASGCLGTSPDGQAGQHVVLDYYYTIISIIIISSSSSSSSSICTENY